MSHPYRGLHHPLSGARVQTWEGFSWPCLLFGCFWFLYKEMWAAAVITLAAALLTFGLSWLVVPFFANQWHHQFLVNKGYSESAARAQPQPAATETGAELERLAQLVDRGFLTREEFETKKRSLLST